MKKHLFFALFLCIASVHATIANSTTEITIQKDSTRIAELDQFWTELSRTVREGDFVGYKNTYHEDAVIIFAAGKNKSSVSLTSALNGWKKGFDDTKAGKMKADVNFRFSQRIGSSTTAHDTGIFVYESTNSKGKTSKQFVHFEMLFVKKNGKWLAVMEHQKSFATQEEWNALK